MRLALALLAILLPMSLAHAGEAADVLRKGLYEGGRAESLAALAPLAATGDGEARFGLGLIAFTNALEHLAQALHRHGFAPDDQELGGGPLAAIIPPNADPAPLDYAGVRAILAQWVGDLDAARAGFLLASDDKALHVPVDLLKVRLDIDGDGRFRPNETLRGLLGALISADEAQLLPASGEIGFDRADAFWLAGYSQLLATPADFLLAHDFETFVDAVFHRLFPRAGFPMQGHVRSTGSVMLDPQTDNVLADVIAAIHTLNMPVTDRARLAGIRQRLLSVVGLSRQNWDAILAETDNDHELLPSPRQTALAPDIAVTDEMIAAWRQTLDAAEAILDGRLLLPHWRFDQGIDLRAWFEGAERTDLVMMFSGYDLLGFLKDGPVASATTFTAANRVFGDSLPGFAVWFN